MPYDPPARDKMVMDSPDSITIEQFVWDEKYGRHPISKSLDPFTDGLSGKSYSAEKVKQRVDLLSRAIAKEHGWKTDVGTEFDKVSCIYSVNTIDTLPISWAIHRLGGLSTPANAGYNASELEYQLKISKAQSIFTSVLNLDNALEAARKVGIPDEKIFLINLPSEALGGKQPPKGFRTVDDLIEEGSNFPKIKTLKLKKGEGATRTAFLCFSSGTSGLPKGVMISHRNVISNTLIMKSNDIHYRKTRSPTGKADDYQERKLCLLPLSHIYGLVIIAHQGVYSGDQSVVLPSFNLELMLKLIQNYKLSMLYLVPPIVIALTRNKPLVDKYDLSSVGTLMSGAAPLGKEVSDDLNRMFPKWLIRQAYGMTETSTGVFYVPFDDLVPGSVGCVLPDIQVKIVDPNSLEEITELGKPGELWVNSPSNALGYLNNEKATKETFVHADGRYWVRTGDEVKAEKSEKGNMHFFIVDRIKELIKVKGHQVAPAELEAHLLSHPSVADCAVIPILDDRAGERPKAFIVKSSSVGLEENDRMVKRDIMKYVEKHKSDYKWIKEIEFIDVIPKSPSGKILRRLLRDKDREERRKQGAKL